MFDNLVSQKNIFNSVEVVRFYEVFDKLQKPEAAILALLKSELKKARMLDLGVGAGRTAKFFKDQVEQYVGIDYAPAMVEACKRRFINQSGNFEFLVSDARDLSRFKSGDFDFVLFSFNGIDYAVHEDRLKILREIKRVMKNGGLFYFSTHNQNDIHNRLAAQFAVHFSGGLKPALASLKNQLFFRLSNLKLKNDRNSDYIRINDGGHEFRLKTYHIKPAKQIEQLEKAGFRKVRVFLLSTGLEIIDHSRLDTIVDPWLYYLCTV